MFEKIRTLGHTIFAIIAFSYNHLVSRTCILPSTGFFKAATRFEQGSCHFQLRAFTVASSRGRDKSFFCKSVPHSMFWLQEIARYLGNEKCWTGIEELSLKNRIPVQWGTNASSLQLQCVTASASAALFMNRPRSIIRISILSSLTWCRLHVRVRISLSLGDVISKYWRADPKLRRTACKLEVKCAIEKSVGFIAQAYGWRDIYQLFNSSVVSPIQRFCKSSLHVEIL